MRGLSDRWRRARAPGIDGVSGFTLLLSMGLLLGRMLHLTKPRFSYQFHGPRCYSAFMETLTLQLPEQVAAKLAATSTDVATRVKIELALNLYSQGEITHAQACELAGMSRMDFETLLQQREVVRPYTIEMLDEDVRNAGSR